MTQPNDSTEERAREIDRIAGIMYKNSTDEADEGKWIDAKDYHKVATIIYDSFARTGEKEVETYRVVKADTDTCVCHWNGETWVPFKNVERIISTSPDKTR